MKKTRKQILKSALAVVVSLTLTIVLAFGGSVTPTITALAATKTITVGETWHESWSASQDYEYFEFKVSETGFYSLTFTDHKQTSETRFLYWDLSAEQGYGDYFNKEIKNEPYILDRIYLISGHTYCAYYSYCYEYYDDQTENYYTTNYDAEASVKLSKSAYTPITLSSSTTVANLDNNTTSWIGFETTTAGDYTLNISDTSVNIYGDLYNASTGEYIDFFDSEYYNCDGKSVFANKIVMPLDANTKYYFYTYSYSSNKSEYSINFSLTKNAKSVKDITINSALVDFKCWLSEHDINEHCFDYKVEYTNGTSSIMRCYEINAAGLKTPYVDFAGNSTVVNGERILIAGKQAVFTYYNENNSIFYINIESLTDYCSDTEAVYPLDICAIEYESRDEFIYYWRIKVNETAVYDTFNYVDNSLNDNLDFFRIEIVDEKNNIIQYNENIMGWPLVAGREYVLSFNYQYDSYSTSTIEWWLQKVSDSVFPDAQAGGWYHDAVTYSAGRGILKGYSNGNFGTADGIQRQDFLVMLARLDGVDLEEYAYASRFPDVGSNSYYEAAVNWGYENGIVTGYENGYFGVGDMINREQIVTFLYRYANYKSLDISVSNSSVSATMEKYADYSSVSDYAQNAMLWAIDRGVIKGKNATTISPTGTAQRCEIAQIMYNIFINEIF